MKHHGIATDANDSLLFAIASSFEFVIPTHHNAQTSAIYMVPGTAIRTEIEIEIYFTASSPSRPRRTRTRNHLHLIKYFSTVHAVWAAEALKLWRIASNTQ